MQYINTDISNSADNRLSFPKSPQIIKVSNINITQESSSKGDTVTIPAHLQEKKVRRYIHPIIINNNNNLSNNNNNNNINNNISNTNTSLCSYNAPLTPATTAASIKGINYLSRHSSIYFEGCGRSMSPYDDSQCHTQTNITESYHNAYRSGCSGAGCGSGCGSVTDLDLNILLMSDKLVLAKRAKKRRKECDGKTSAVNVCNTTKIGRENDQSCQSSQAAQEENNKENTSSNQNPTSGIVKKDKIVISIISEDVNKQESLKAKRVVSITDEEEEKATDENVINNNDDIQSSTVVTSKEKTCSILVPSQIPHNANNATQVDNNNTCNDAAVADNPNSRDDIFPLGKSDEEILHKRKKYSFTISKRLKKLAELQLLWSETLTGLSDQMQRLASLVIVHWPTVAPLLRNTSSTVSTGHNTITYDGAMGKYRDRWMQIICYGIMNLCSSTVEVCGGVGDSSAHAEAGSFVEQSSERLYCKEHLAYIDSRFGACSTAPIGSCCSGDISTISVAKSGGTCDAIIRDLTPRERFILKYTNNIHKSPIVTVPSHSSLSSPDHNHKRETSRDHYKSSCATQGHNNSSITICSGNASISGNTIKRPYGPLPLKSGSAVDEENSTIKIFNMSNNIQAGNTTAITGSTSVRSLSGGLMVPKSPSKVDKYKTSLRREALLSSLLHLHSIVPLQYGGNSGIPYNYQRKSIKGSRPSAADTAYLLHKEVINVIIECFCVLSTLFMIAVKISELSADIVRRREKRANRRKERSRRRAPSQILTPQSDAFPSDPLGNSVSYPTIEQTNEVIVVDSDKIDRLDFTGHQKDSNSNVYEIVQSSHLQERIKNKSNSDGSSPLDTYIPKSPTTNFSSFKPSLTCSPFNPRKTSFHYDTSDSFAQDSIEIGSRSNLPNSNYYSSTGVDPTIGSPLSREFSPVDYRFQHFPPPQSKSDGLISGVISPPFSRSFLNSPIMPNSPSHNNFNSWVLDYPRIDPKKIRKLKAVLLDFDKNKMFYDDTDPKRNVEANADNITKSHHSSSCATPVSPNDQTTSKKTKKPFSSLHLVYSIPRHRIIMDVSTPVLSRVTSSCAGGPHGSSHHSVTNKVRSLSGAGMGWGIQVRGGVPGARDSIPSNSLRLCSPQENSALMSSLPEALMIDTSGSGSGFQTNTKRQQKGSGSISLNSPPGTLQQPSPSYSSCSPIHMTPSSPMLNVLPFQRSPENVCHLPPLPHKVSPSLPSLSMFGIGDRSNRSSICGLHSRDSWESDVIKQLVTLAPGKRGRNERVKFEDAEEYIQLALEKVNFLEDLAKRQAAFIQQQKQQQ